jgi:putative FmdB family regulatory protein
MPIFEFDCPDCGEPFEKLVRNTATEPVVCPTCGSKKVKKKLSRIATKTNGGSSSASDSGSSSCSTGGT